MDIVIRIVVRLAFYALFAAILGLVRWMRRPATEAVAAAEPEPTKAVPTSAPQVERVYFQDWN